MRSGITRRGGEEARGQREAVVIGAASEVFGLASWLSRVAESRG